MINKILFSILISSIWISSVFAWNIKEQNLQQYCKEVKTADLIYNIALNPITGWYFYSADTNWVVENIKDWKVISTTSKQYEIDDFKASMWTKDVSWWGTFGFWGLYSLDWNKFFYSYKSKEWKDMTSSQTAVYEWVALWYNLNWDFFHYIDNSNWKRQYYKNWEKIDLADKEEEQITSNSVDLDKINWKNFKFYWKDYQWKSVDNANFWQYSLNTTDSKELNNVINKTLYIWKISKWDFIFSFDSKSLQDKWITSLYKNKQTNILKGIITDQKNRIMFVELTKLNKFKLFDCNITTTVQKSSVKEYKLNKKQKDLLDSYISKLSETEKKNLIKDFQDKISQNIGRFKENSSQYSLLKALDNYLKNK